MYKYDTLSEITFGKHNVCVILDITGKGCTLRIDDTEIAFVSLDEVLNTLLEMKKTAGDALSYIEDYIINAPDKHRDCAKVCTRCK